MFAFKKISGLNTIRTHDLCDAGADALTTEPFMVDKSIVSSNKHVRWL